MRGARKAALKVSRGRGRGVGGGRRISARRRSNRTAVTVPATRPKIGKTSRQETSAAIRPPAAVRKAAAAAELVASKATAPGRRAYGTVSPTYARVSGKTAAAATPVKNRRAVIAGREGGRPQAAVPALKKTIARETTRTLP